MEHCYILPEYQRKGIATYFLKNIMEIVKKNNNTYLTAIGSNLQFSYKFLKRFDVQIIKKKLFKFAPIYEVQFAVPTSLRLYPT